MVEEEPEKSGAWHAMFSVQTSWPHFSPLPLPWIPLKSFLLPQPHHQCNENPKPAVSCNILPTHHQQCILQHYWWEKHTYVGFGSVWHPYYCFKNSSQGALPLHAGVDWPSSTGTISPRNRLRPRDVYWSPDSIKAWIWVSGNLSEKGLSKTHRVEVKQATQILRNYLEMLQSWLHQRRHGKGVGKDQLETSWKRCKVNKS